jgi:hypothetical protein
MLLRARLCAAQIHHARFAQRLTLRLTGRATEHWPQFARLALRAPVEPFVRRTVGLTIPIRKSENAPYPKYRSEISDLIRFEQAGTN